MGARQTEDPLQAYDESVYRKQTDLSLHVCYSRADAVVHVSEFARREQKLFKDKAVCIHHGVVPLPYEPKSGSGPVRFLFLGRTEPDKGIEIIVRAFAKLPAEMAVLDVVGTGESASWLRLRQYPISWFQQNGGGMV